MGRGDVGGGSTALLELTADPVHAGLIWAEVLERTGVDVSTVGRGGGTSPVRALALITYLANEQGTVCWAIREGDPSLRGWVPQVSAIEDSVHTAIAIAYGSAGKKYPWPPDRLERSRQARAARTAATEGAAATARLFAQALGAPIRTEED